MRSELVKQIFLAFAQGNRDRFIEVAYQVVKEEEKKHHHLLAKDLKEILQGITSGKNLSSHRISQRYKDALPIPRDNEKGFPLLEVREYHLSWRDVILDEELHQALHQIVEENRQWEILATHGLTPKQRVLFCGPPGTGKTLSAQVVSSVIGYPLANIRFDSIVSSFLGETASNLRRIFQFIERGRWLVLFDEFDVIGKQRDDPHEHGEIKRVVNNFMQMLDGFDGESLIIAATNHQHLLDPGLWRRFDEILFFDIPSHDRRVRIFTYYLKVLDKDPSLDLDALARETEGFSPADIAQVCWEALRRTVLKDGAQVGEQELREAIARQKRRKAVQRRQHGAAV